MYRSLFFISFMQKIQMIIRLIFIAMSFLSLPSIFSQTQIQDPLSGRVLNVSKYAGISGSPFLNDLWINGDVTIKKGVYANIPLKYDAFSNVLYFNRNDELFEFDDDVISFVLKPNNEDVSTYRFFVKGLEGLGVKRNQFLQQLYNGVSGFYKATFMFLSETNKINEGVVKNFQKTEKYFFKQGDKIIQINLSKKDILALFGEKQTKVESYTTAAGLSYKKESDVSKIFQYFDGLR